MLEQEQKGEEEGKEKVKKKWFSILIIARSFLSSLAILVHVSSCRRPTEPNLAD